MIWTEHIIARAVALQTLARKCVVLVDNCNWTGHECDVLAVTTDLRVIDVEVKISRSDLKADAKKDKWWHRQWGHWKDGKPVQPQPIARQWPPRVWKHYYAMPADIWKPDLLDALPSKASGVILMREQKPMFPGDTMRLPPVAEVVRRATPNKTADRLKPEDVMDIARLANLRMWDAYQREEVAQKDLSTLRQREAA